MYRKDLTQPLTPVAAKVPIGIDLARDDDMDEVAGLFHHANPDRVPRRARWFRKRLKDGSLCFIAHAEGDIVGYNWIRVHSAIGVHGQQMQLKADEIYTTDAYTAKDWRGYGIHPALNYAMLQFAKRLWLPDCIHVAPH